MYTCIQLKYAGISILGNGFYTRSMGAIDYGKYSMRYSKIPHK